MFILVIVQPSDYSYDDISCKETHTQLSTITY